MDEPGTSGGRWRTVLTRWVLTACATAWPAEARRRDGTAMLDTARILVGEAFDRGPVSGMGALLGEALALIREGVVMRTRRMREVFGHARAGWVGDLRIALRALRRRPAFTGVATLTLALGIGATTTVYHLVERTIFRAPPYEAPDELLLVWNRFPDSGERIPVAGPDAAALAAGSPSLAMLAFAMRGVDGVIEVSDALPEHVRVSAVTGNFFTLLGTPPVLGRVLGPEDGPAGVDPDGVAPPVVVLAHRTWRRLFAEDPAAVGTTVRVNGVAATVVGVMPPDFRLAVPEGAGIRADVDLWLALGVPLSELHREERLLDRDADNTGVVVARLAEAATPERARAEAERVARELRASVPAYGAAGLDFMIRPLLSDVRAPARRVLLPIAVGVGVVLLATFLNVATLTLARGVERAGELAVRSALGAGRGRLVRLLFVEGAVVAAIGTLAALAVAVGGGSVLERIVPPSLGALAGSGAQSSFASVTLLGGVAALVFGLAPALRLARPAGIRRGDRHRGRSPLRTGLVVAQVALSTALVVGAALLYGTVATLRSVDPGFEPAGALTFRLSMRAAGDYRSPAQRARLMTRVQEGLAELPGVEAAGLVGMLPLSGERWTLPYGLPGQGPEEWGGNRADFRAITSGAFEALGIRLVEGRGFTAAEDLAEEERVIVVDQRLARRLAPSGSALGRTLGIALDGSAVEARVVGVVESVRTEALDTDAREAIYVPYRQEASRDVAFVVRTVGDRGAMSSAVREIVRGIDPRIPVHELRALEDYVAEALGSRRFALAALTIFAGLALFTAGVGLYGVVAWDVRRRTRDFGIRMAVGADRGDVLVSVLGRALRLGGWGLVAGIVPAWAAARGLEAILVDGSLSDVRAWGSAVGVILAVTLAASLAPAWRASRLDPARTFRAE